MTRAKPTPVDACVRYAGLAPREPVPCKTSYLGREVPLARGGGKLGRVVGCARPEFGCGTPDLTIKKSRGGYVTEPYRRVKDRVHDYQRGPLCENALRPSLGMSLARAFGATKPQYQGGELPFPHRAASSPCCSKSPVYPDEVDARLADLRAGRGFVTLEDLGEALDKRLPPQVKAKLRAAGHYPVAGGGRAAVVAAVKATRGYCVELVAKIEAAQVERAKLSRSQALGLAKAKRRAKADR